MICIGGVCVPYSAVIPLILMGMKWVFAKLYLYGLLPTFLAELMNLKPTTSDENKSKISVTDKPARRGKSDPVSKPAAVVELESAEQFDDLLKNNEKMVLKFTADWCQPCKKIHPFYQQKCKDYSGVSFLTIDVDEFDDISQKYGVAMMPTFVVVQGTSVVGTYKGSSEPELEEFLRTNLR